MNGHKQLIVLALVGIMMIGVATPVAAHETQNVEGYDITFGGAEEPLITGERMWLEIEIVGNEIEEPVEGQADSLNMYVQSSGNDRDEVDLSEKHGEDGVYEAPVIFTEAGNYTIHLEGSIEDTEVHTHFDKEVHDHTGIEYPSDESQRIDNTDESQTDDNQTEEAGFGSVSVVIAAIGAVGAIGTFLVGRQH